MKLWIFPSENKKNIKIGYDNCMWAVTYVNEATMKGRHTKATGLKKGDAGLLYCSENQSFTVPFLMKSFPEFCMVHDVWPEPWSLPFDIKPLGSPDKFMNLNTMTHELGISGNPTFSLNGLNGRTIFVPNKITDLVWSWILKNLGSEPASNAEPLLSPERPREADPSASSG